MAWNVDDKQNEKPNILYESTKDKHVNNKYQNIRHRNMYLRTIELESKVLYFWNAAQYTITQTSSQHDAFINISFNADSICYHI